MHNAPIPGQTTTKPQCPRRRVGFDTTAIATLLVILGYLPAHARADANRNLDHLRAANGTIQPFLDGYVHPEEWSDASVYTLETDAGQLLTLYIKTVPLYDGDAAQCALYPDNPSFTLPCDDYLWIAATSPSTDQLSYLRIYIDEGDDGAYGSGSGDGVLTVDQEDGKFIDYGSTITAYCGNFYGLVENCPSPSCVPWDDSDDCWKCGLVDTPQHAALEYCYYGTDPSRTAEPSWGELHAMMDGWVTEGLNGPTWEFAASSTKNDPNLLGFFGLVGEDYRGAELAMPFHGIDTGDWDSSDATFEMGDVLNVLLSSDPGSYPRRASSYDPTTWIPLQIGGTAETAEDYADAPGCTAERSPLVSSVGTRGVAVLPVFLVGIALIGARRNRRSRKHGNER